MANLAIDSTPPCPAATKRPGRLAVMKAQESTAPLVTLDDRTSQRKTTAASVVCYFLTLRGADENLDYLKVVHIYIYIYEDRIRAIRLYISLGKRTAAAI